MSYTTRKNLLSPSKYWRKSPRTFKPTSLTIHNTSNDASANNEIAYMISNNISTAYHWAIDDKECVQGLPENRMGWHAGDGSNGKGNNTSLAIEICYSLSGGTRFTNAEKNAAHFAALQLHKRGWNTKQHMVQHNYWTGKNCPMETRRRGWARFVRMVDAELAKLKKPTPAPTPAPKPVNIKGYKKAEAGEYVFIRDARLWDFDETTQKGMKPANKTVYKKGRRIDIVGYAVWKSGRKYRMTGYSYNASPKNTTGFNEKDLKKYVAPKPTPKPVPVPKPVPTPTPKPTPTPTPKPTPKPPEVNKDVEQDGRLDNVEKELGWLRSLLATVGAAITNFLNRKK